MTLGQSDIIYILFVILLGFIMLIVFSNSTSKKYSIPSGVEVYQDMAPGGKILRSHRYGLTGKPDKVIKKRNRLIIYEYKSTSADKPRKGHLLQMGVYFIILEEMYPGSIVDYGILKYRDHSYRVENTQKLKEDVLIVADNMRKIASVSGYPVRNHNNPGRCFKCPFKTGCSQSLIIA